MTDERLAEIQALCDAATLGEWNTDRPDGTYVVSDTRFNVAMTRRAYDAAFIAQSRTIVPELIAEVERVAITLRNNNYKSVNEMLLNIGRLLSENVTLRKALELSCAHLADNNASRVDWQNHFTELAKESIEK